MPCRLRQRTCGGAYAYGNTGADRDTDTGTDRHTVAGERPSGSAENFRSDNRAVLRENKHAGNS